eukprot:jgi/Undpi1/7102/HiC_scaffold_22.g09576.m1
MVSVTLTTVGLLLIAGNAQARQAHETSSWTIPNQKNLVAPRQTSSRIPSSGPLAFALPFWAPSKAQQQTAAKANLLDAITPLDRGRIATEEDAALVETLAQKLEKLNPNPKSLACPLINGRWELLYTTSRSILATDKPAALRPYGPIYQDIDAPGLRAKNSQYVQPVPFLKIGNSVRAELSPTSASAVDVQFIEFKVGPIKIKAPKSAQGALDTTYLDEEVRVSRGDKGNLFVLVKAVGLEPEFS